MVHTYSEATAPLPQNAAPAIRHIILPLDGTRLAERAVEPAIALARGFGADVLLVRCYELDSRLPSANAARTFLSHRPRVPLHAASLYLARMEETLRQRGVRVHSHLYQWPVTSAILQTAAHSADALIVMATRAGSADRQPLHSVAADIMETGIAPVLLLSGDTRFPFAGGSPRGLRVLAVDGQVAAEVEAYAHLLAATFRGTVTHSTSRHASQSHDASVDGLTTEGGRTPRPLPPRANQLASLARAGVDLVVLKASPRRDNDDLDGGNALRSLLAAGLPVLVLP